MKPPCTHAQVGACCTRFNLYCSQWKYVVNNKRTTSRRIWGGFHTLKRSAASLWGVNNSPSHYSQLTLSITRTAFKRKYSITEHGNTNKQEQTIGMAHSPLYPWLGLSAGALWHKMAAMRLHSWLMHNRVIDEASYWPMLDTVHPSAHQNEAWCRPCTVRTGEHRSRQSGLKVLLPNTSFNYI